MPVVVPDASAILAAYFPDELHANAQALMRDYSLGRVDFCAPRLLLLELTNACLIAERRGRIARSVSERLVREFAALKIAWVDVESRAAEVFALAAEHALTAYDACYIVAARMRGCRLVTADARLHRSLAGRVDCVDWLGDYAAWSGTEPASGGQQEPSQRAR